MKQLIFEGIKEKTAEDFLKNLIRGTEFENHLFLAGGYVRDEFLNLDPKDLDIVVDLPNGGIEFTEWAAKRVGNYKEGSNPVIYPTFGTAKWSLKGITHNGIDLSSIDVECVMTRGEKYTTGSRKPDVHYSDLKTDVERRDATVNSLLKNISTGEILDLTGKGKQDIIRGIMRTPLDPDITFSDDPLRMLRFIRQSTKYGWEISKESLDGIKRNANKLNTISKERVRDEINKILVTGNPRKGFELLRDTGLLPYVAQEFQQAVGMTQNKYHSQTVFDHILTVLEKTKPTLISRIGALLHDIGKVATRQVIDGEVHFYEHEKIGADIAEKIMAELKYPNDIIKPVVLAIRNHMRLKQSGKEGEKISDKSLRKFIVDMGDHLEDVMDIIHSDNISHAEEFNMPNQIPNILKRIENLKSSIPDKKMPLPVTGEDLKKMGLLPGPLFRELLDLVKDKQLESPGTKKEEYLEMIKKYLKLKNV